MLFLTHHHHYNNPKTTIIICLTIKRSDNHLTVPFFKTNVETQPTSYINFAAFCDLCNIVNTCTIIHFRTTIMREKPWHASVYLQTMSVFHETS